VDGGSHDSLIFESVETKGSCGIRLPFFLYSTDVLEKELLHTICVEKFLLKNIG
jgi:hypothetical protein